MEKCITFILLGVVLLILGITNCRGNISTIHWYNRRKVTPADTAKFGKYMGIGTIICGISLLITALLEFIFQNPVVEILILLGFIIGLAYMFFAQFKYNKGLF